MSIVFTKKVPLTLYSLNSVSIDESYKLIDVYIDNQNNAIALFHKFNNISSGTLRDYRIYINIIGSSSEGRHDYIEDATIFYKVIRRTGYEFKDPERVVTHIDNDDYIVYVNRLM